MDIPGGRPKTLSVLREIGNERIGQNIKWGEQNHNPSYWLGILMEEVGESAQEVMAADVHPEMTSVVLQMTALGAAAKDTIERYDYLDPEPMRENIEVWQLDVFERLRVELIQTAAVAVNIIESLDRNELKGKTT